MSEAIVRAYWERMEARDWAAVRAALADDAVATWWTSRERFQGGDAIVQVNRIYPEGWHVSVRELVSASDGRVVSVVRVAHGAATFFATSFFRFTGPRIATIDEYWATAEPPAAWRPAGFIAGHSVLSADEI